MRRDALLVAEMIDAAERIVELIGTSSGDEIDADRTRREAVLWNFTVLGEASNQVSDATRLLSAGIPWRDPVRVRNRIVHGYASVDMDVLVVAAQDDLPGLLDGLRALAVQLSGADGPEGEASAG